MRLYIVTDTDRYDGPFVNLASAMQHQMNLLDAGLDQFDGPVVRELTAVNTPEFDSGEHALTLRQYLALAKLCANYKVLFDPDSFYHPFDFPAGYVTGQVGPIFVGCSPEGDISS
jgi:hypothetical protein